MRAHAVVRAQGRVLCAGSGLPGLRAGGALTWADVLVLVCVLRFRLEVYQFPSKEAPVSCTHVLESSSPLHPPLALKHAYMQGTSKQTHTGGLRTHPQP